VLTVQCPSCGSFNDETAAVCYFCKKPLAISPERTAKIQSAAATGSSAGVRKRAAGFTRPGCVSLYAGFFFLDGILGIAGLITALSDASGFNPSVLSSQLSGAGELDPNFLRLVPAYWALALILVLFFSILNLAVGWGLWTMRNWARVYVMVAQGIGVLSCAALLFFSIVAFQGNLCITGMYLIPLALSAYIFVYFWERRKMFR
jgi:uncharacterized membrane protein (DUF2068 family)